MWRSPCKEGGICTKHFPKKFVETMTVDDDGYTLYRHRNNGRLIEKNHISLDNRFILPYNPQLLMQYQVHINVELCNQGKSIKYLFKYVNKGYDCITASLYQVQQEGKSFGNIDEIKSYYDYSYVSTCEVCWRIFSYKIHHRQPSVERLKFHLPGEQLLVVTNDGSLENVVNRDAIKEMMFIAWMEKNKEDSKERKLTYVDFPLEYVYKEDVRKWFKRKQGFSIGRINFVPQLVGELYYLHILLNKVRGLICYEDIRIVNGIVYDTFKEACYAWGLFDDDKKYIAAIKEASLWGSGQYLHKLYCTMLFCNCLTEPKDVWKETWLLLSENILYIERRRLQIEDLTLVDDQLQNYALVDIEKILRRNGHSLHDFFPMLVPNLNALTHISNRLVADEFNYDREVLRNEATNLFNSLTYEQKEVFNTLINAVKSGNGGVFFLFGYGGTGKTYIWKTLPALLRSEGRIVFCIASSGIASILLRGGCKAHSRFAIPLDINEDSTCNIKQESPQVELLCKTDLIILDETLMVHKFCFEALNKTLRDILQFDNPNSHNLPFGGKTIIFGGDFQQILLVIPRGGHSDIVNATLNSSYLWDYCCVLTLTKNMWLEGNSLDYFEVDQLTEFLEWILKIGNGNLGEPNDGEVDIEIPNDLLIKDYSDLIEAIVHSTYPALVQNLDNKESLRDLTILGPRLSIVDELNSYILSLVNNEEKEYLSSNSICKTSLQKSYQVNLLTPEFLNGIHCSRLPNHKLNMKVDVPIMLMRNMDQFGGLCNGTRLIITQLANHVIKAEVVTGRNISLKVFIPRMVLSPSQSKWPLKFQRRQFPIIVSYAMCINKSQGQSLKSVGLYLPKSVFSHGQLYVAISRVKSREGLERLIHDNDKGNTNVTTNVVFKEVFQNL